ncbi:MAG: protein kinase, partial [Chloroflexi bacterium]|nr:protein kinase [Chloroflexota bacterium]
MIGQTIKDTYQVYEDVGQGAAATVYMARDLSRNRVVALKAIHPHLTKEGRFLERFRLEAELLSKVKSPHIVQIYDFGKEDDVNYIVMEYLEGKTLSDIIQERGPLDVSEVLCITRQIAECLGA